MNANDEFETLAAEFERDTGYLAPGKSESPVCWYEGRDHERIGAWRTWDRLRAELSRLRSLSTRWDLADGTYETLPEEEVTRRRKVAAKVLCAVNKKRWMVTLTCCGRDNGIFYASSWDEANKFRESYTSGPYVNERGYSAHETEDGHKRSGVISLVPCPYCGQGEGVT